MRQQSRAGHSLDDRTLGRSSLVDRSAGPTTVFGAPERAPKFTNATLAASRLLHRRLPLPPALALAHFRPGAPHHSRTFRSTTAAAMPALSKMDLQRAAA